MGKSSRVVWQTERGCSGTQFERRPRRHNQGSIVDMGVYFGTLRIGVETPPYQVVRKCGGYEIRKYQPSVAAEVFVDVKDQFSREGGGKGFRPLAKYIGAFGTPENVSRSPEEATQAEKIAMTAPVVTRPSSGDSKGQKIAMTAPVVTTKSDDQSDGGGYWMQFIMPSKWTLETLPTPTDPNVKLKPIPERFVAAKFFSGRANDAMVKSKEAALLECLARDGIIVTEGAKPELARYNDPFTPGFLRTNEVWVQIEEPKA